MEADWEKAFIFLRKERRKMYLKREKRETLKLDRRRINLGFKKYFWVEYNISNAYIFRNFENWSLVLKLNLGGISYINNWKGNKDLQWQKIEKCKNILNGVYISNKWGMTDEGTGILSRSFDSLKASKSKDISCAPSKSKVQMAWKMSQEARKESRIRFERKPPKSISQHLTRLNQDYFRKKKKEMQDN